MLVLTRTAVVLARRTADQFDQRFEITAALSAGVDLRAVQQYARHSDPATTIRYDRSRLTLDRHPAYLVDIHIAGGSA